MTQPGEVIKPDSWKVIDQEGMPLEANPYEKGNLYIQFDVKFPDSLTPQQVDALTQVLLTPPYKRMRITCLLRASCVTHCMQAPGRRHRWPTSLLLSRIEVTWGVVKLQVLPKGPTENGAAMQVDDAEECHMRSVQDFEQELKQRCGCVPIGPFTIPNLQGNLMVAPMPHAADPAARV